MDNIDLALRAAGMDKTSLKRFRGEGSETIWLLPTDGANAVPMWQLLRDVVNTSGLHPVILGGDADLLNHQELLDDDALSADEGIRKGLGLDPTSLIEGWKVDLQEDDPDADLDAYHGEWPQGDHATSTYAISTEEGPLWVGLFPAKAGWELPARVPFGGWNACPQPAEHVCMMKRWYDLYGAEVVCMTQAVVEMQIARPPVSREAAMQLALEQFAYCEDIVSQGTETVERLAATLLNGTVWYFWWD